MFATSIFDSLKKQIESFKGIAKAKGRAEKRVKRQVEEIECQIKNLQLKRAALVLEIEMANASAEALENVLRSGKELQVSK